MTKAVTGLDIHLSRSTIYIEFASCASYVLKSIRAAYITIMSEQNLLTKPTSKRPIYLPNELLIKILKGLIESYSLQIRQDGHYPVKFVNLPRFLLNIKLANSLFYDDLTRLLESRFDGRL